MGIAFNVGNLGANKSMEKHGDVMQYQDKNYVDMAVEIVDLCQSISSVGKCKYKVKKCIYETWKCK